MIDTLIKIAECLAIIVPIIVSMRESFSKTTKQIGGLEQKLADHIREDGDNMAKQLRIRILRFDDELYQGVLHSENHFEDILDDIDAYKTYCDNHPNFHNSRGGAAMKHIKAVYEKCKEEHSFLN